jgi:hypothetical protein
MDVIAIGLDESDDDIKKWKNKISELPTWKHLGDPQGVNGEVAIDYFILSTPAMILITSDTKEIIALPLSIQELISAIPGSP